MNFTHLHLHNEFSFLDGLGSAEEFAKRAKELDFKHLAITNHGNVDGCIKFQNACQEQGVHPIIGCELYIVPDLKIKEKGEKRKHITVIVKNKTGWQNLLKMLSVSHLEGFYYRPRVDPETVLKHSEGLLFGSACTASLLLEDWGLKLFEELTRREKNSTFIEIMPHIMEEQYLVNEFCIDTARKESIVIVATNDCHYVSEGDEKTQEVLLAIQSKKKWNDKDRWKFSIDGLYLKTKDEMKEAFSIQNKLPRRLYSQAIENTQLIVDICKGFFIPKVEVDLPPVPGVVGIDEEFLRMLCEKRLSEINPSKKRTYRKRMNEELELIIKLGFARYFLIVWELIKWCKDNNILTGPGRGSVGGSLVAYLLGITQVDPIKYNLLFARFISPARIDLPDIDMDFEDIKRPLVFKHLKDTYGANCVAGASTFSTMKGRGALHDVARVFDVPLADVNKAAKAIVVRSGGDFRSDFTIEDAFVTFEDGKEFKKKYPEVTKYAIDIEGQVKGVGQHAAAMVISSTDLKQGDRSYLKTGKDNEYVVNWDKHDLEYSGLMKLDVLGLSALTIIGETLRLIEKNKNIKIDLEKIPIDDKKVFAEFTAGNNIGIFQFGSLGLRKVCQEVGIDDFNMLSHVNALHRPGTLRSGMTAEFGRRKRGEVKWSHIHPVLEEITGDTYGIILYQEQVMRFMYDLGGLGWKTADTVRKVISKSQGVEQFLKFKDMFIEGCLERKTLDAETAGKLWDELASFGSYGFNLSHSVEYSMISYWEMWLKIYYSAEYICSCLSYGQEDKKEDLIQECRRLNIEVRPPKFNISDSTRWVIKNNILYSPFIEIKGFGEKLSENILKIKQEKGFFKINNKAISKKIKDCLDDIKVFSDEEVSEEGLSKVDKYFSFSFSKDVAFLYRGIIKKISELIPIRPVKEIDFKVTEMNTSFYFGRMTEVKFGYRGKFDSLEKKLGASGTADSLGGVYGNLQDDTDFVMLVFDSKFYLRRKYDIEHCGGEHILVKANHPLRTSSINGLDGWFGNDLLTCNMEGLDLKLIKNKRFRREDYNLLDCQECELRSQCKSPVYPSRGNKNIMIIGEAPGKIEDREGKGFIGPSGEMVWNKFAKEGFYRDSFHITNVGKCFPSESKTPSKKQIKTCGKLWLEKELETVSPIIVLAFGNSCVSYFKGEESGIMNLNGTTEWSDQYNCWICWCIHPASVLYHRENEKMFEEGINNFLRKLRFIGME